MALADALRTFMYVSLWGKPVISVARGMSGLIKSIFRAGEQGFAYDINDLSTLFQDAAGTIPVTAAGQPVGLMLDKSKGLMLGSERLVNGDFENGLAATKIDSSGSVSTWELNSSSPISGTQDGKLSITTSASGRPALTFPTPSRVLGGLYEISFDYKVTSGEATIFGIYNGASTQIVNEKLTGQGKFKKRYTALAAVADDLIYFGNTLCVIQIDNVSIKQVLGNHAYQTTSASRPLLQRNATTGAYYLAFDGTDDFLVTNSIDFTATDKVSLFAGVRKLSDAVTAIVAELSGSSDRGNAFALFAPALNGSYKFLFRSGGSVIDNNGGAFTTSSAYSAPYTAILTGNGHIGSDTTALRINSQTVAVSNTDQGTGNYGNYPLYIGRRGGTSLPFAGHLYSLIGIGRLTTDSETTSLEKSIAKNVGVTL